jgi:hypothetical protein
MFCGGGGRHQREKEETGNKEENEGVHCVCGITLKLDVDSERAEGVHSGRNRGKRPPESEKGNAMWRRLGAPGLNSFCQEQEEVEPHPPVPAERLGVAGDDGDKVFAAAALSGLAEKKKRKREELLAARGRGKIGLGFLGASLGNLRKRGGSG